MSYSDEYDPDDGVAIIGLAGRFPGARNVDELWENLVEGRETISAFSDDELEPAGPEEMMARRHPAYVRSRGILADVEGFDAAFFGINPSEAAILDPQQRVFMETAWEALESAGHEPRSFPGPIGVFAGMSNNSYFLQHLLSRHDVTDVVGWLTTMMGNEKDYLATRVSYKLDLRGPALNLQTACSTSLVAVASAVQSLLTYQCDLALAGGVSITLPQRRGYLHQDGGITSPDGHCRSFDERAAGTVFSNGVGIVTLRRLVDALADGDTVFAVIKGVGLNNDGAAKVSFTAPSVEGHAGVITMAQALAGIDPQTISYLEAHGTGTALGDPIEIAGLTQAFRAGGAAGNGYCGIGSIKSAIGHLDAAAGVAGLIKTALALHHKTLPPSLHFTAPNPKLDLEASPFRVVDSLRPWQSPEGQPRRAGVSSFGVGGTNAHVVMEEAPQQEPSAASDTEQLLVLSARSASTLDAATARLRQHLVDCPEHPLGDVAFTLREGRRRFEHRRAVVARGTGDAIASLAALDPERTVTGSGAVEGASVAFLFPGQGAQSVGMARRLYEADSAFRADIDDSAAVLRPLLQLDLRDILYPRPGGEESAESRLGQTAVTQPALFVVEHALAMAWRRLGVEPDGMIGHSVGEYVAACLGGLFTRDDALRLIATRARLMQSLPGGSMLAVQASADVVRDVLPDDLEIAAENAPGVTVVSGETPAIEAFSKRLAVQDLAARRLATSHAFHSAMMEPILGEFAREVASIPRSAPHTPWISSLTGDWIQPDEALDEAYWVQQLRRPVLFAEGISRLLEGSSRVPLEVGPGQHLTGLTRRTLPNHPRGTLTLGGQGQGSSLLLPAGQLWVAGVSFDSTALNIGAGRRRIPLPTYPFDRKRHWVERGIAPAEPAANPSSNGHPHRVEMPAPAPSGHPARKDAIVGRLRGLIANLSGLEAASLDPAAAFLELGLDSLFLTQAALQLQKTFEVKISFRQLMGDLSTMDALAAHLDATLPAEVAPSPSVASAPVEGLPIPSLPTAERAATSGATSSGGAVERLITEQLEIMRQQLDTMRRLNGAAATTAPASPAGGPPAVSSSQPAPVTAAAPVAAFGPYRPVTKAPAAAVTAKQESAVSAFIDRYTRRTAASKSSTATHRPHLADPRSVSGFRPLWKEMVYPIVTVRSVGARLWDLDGNEYVDLTNGFGAVLFGHNPGFVRQALQAQLDQGIEIGPQSLLAGEVASRVAAMVGMERVAFCNTGSEAVSAAVRVARTVTGRDRIALFAGAYHGIFDEVLVRAAGGGAMPIAPGIPQEMVSNVVVLDYGTESALKYLKAHGGELAAVLVEPVQSRRPDLQPREFLHDVRRAADASGTALVFDEIVTGFRSHPGGTQALFGVRADIATFGKVIGGGLPIGLVAGRSEYLDALDGGAWNYGDDSVPEVGVTFFAGTFVRHPLALAAARSVIAHLEAEGPELQRELNLRTTAFAARLAEHARDVGAPVRVRHFSSWLYVDLTGEAPHAGIFYAMMRDRGVHVWEGRCWFLTTAHSEADLERVFEAFRDTIAEMQAGDILGAAVRTPVPGARLGRDADGREAWFVADPTRPGAYLQVEQAATHG